MVTHVGFEVANNELRREVLRGSVALGVDVDDGHLVALEEHVVLRGAIQLVDHL